MENKDGKYFISTPVSTTEPTKKKLVEVTKEQYKAFYQPVWRTREHAKRHGGCSCADWRKCSGDCWACKFHTAGDIWSLEKIYEDIGDAAEASSRADGAPLPHDHHDPYRHIEPAASLQDELGQVLDGIVYGAIADRIKALSAEESAICECILLDLTEREAAERLGLSKSTYHDRKEKLFARLRTEWADLL